MAQVPADELARTLREKPELMPPVLRNLGTALMDGDARLAKYVGELARAAATRGEDMPQLAAIILIDPLRYREDEAFRKRMNSLMPRTIAMLPQEKKRALFAVPTPLEEIDIDVLEPPSRRIAFETAKLEMPDDVTGPIEASIYSLTSSFFTAEEVKRFLSAVHQASPKRRLMVIADAPMRKALTGFTFVDNYARPFTPWPRDPFIVARSAKDEVVFVNSPNVQQHRTEDRNMSRLLARALPAARWTVSPLPFHNGHVLLSPTTVWISSFSLEAFGSHGPAEIEAFYGRPVRFAHARSADVSGGAGIDLDSVLTILPNGHALVGDSNLGIAAVRSASPEEFAPYRFRGDPREAIVRAQRPALQRYLDEIAAELKRDGLIVHRLPLLTVPASLVAWDDVPEGFEFLLTWNNVVLEKRRAEGFASLLKAADDAARRTFEAAGYKLVLFPPLIHSIVLGGGYRCASNHVRPARR